MLRQIEFAVFDMRLHSDFDPAAGRTAQQLLEEVRSRIAVLRPPAYNRFPNNFSHIFAGGYAAGYYGYKWAEVCRGRVSFFEGGGRARSTRGAALSRRDLAVGGSRPRRSRSAPSAGASRASMPC